jgi:hypothetical protein
VLANHLVVCRGRQRMGRCGPALDQVIDLRIHRTDRRAHRYQPVVGADHPEHQQRANADAEPLGLAHRSAAA